MGTIVVGVDGSQESKEALRWAADEARLRQADLRVVYAYEFKPAWLEYAYGGSTPGDVVRLRERMESEATEAREHAEMLVKSLVGEVVGDTAPTQTAALEDRHPAEALVKQSQDADMLVVGSRGRGGFTGLVLGSVSQQCVHHARCPVVVIRSRR